MIRSRRKHAAVVAGASVLVAMASLAIVPLSASATGSAGTTTSVTATPNPTTTGHLVTIVAEVAPVTTNASVPTGTVTFTISGGTNCKTSDTQTINVHGKATCTIPSGVLLGADSPYGISAAYSGDGNFAGSTGSASETVSAVKSHTKLRAKPKVSNHSANVFTAIIKAGSASKLVSGFVRFGVSSSPGPTNHNKLNCAGGNLQPVSVSGNVATATCSLSSGWFVVPPKTKSDKHPTGSYGVTAVYLGNGSFISSEKVKRGTVG